jgi:glutaminase
MILTRSHRYRAGFGVALACAALLAAPARVHAQMNAADIQKAVDAAYAKYKDSTDGKNADYIPALAKVDSKIYGIALVTTDGKMYTAGDLKSEVSIQSISKVFTMAYVMQQSAPTRSRTTWASTRPGRRSTRSPPSSSTRAPR